MAEVEELDFDYGIGHWMQHAYTCYVLTCFYNWQREKPKHTMIPSHSLLDSLEVRGELMLVTDIFNNYAALTYFSIWTGGNSIGRGGPPTSA